MKKEKNTPEMIEDFAEKMKEIMKKNREEKGALDLDEHKFRFFFKRLWQEMEEELFDEYMNNVDRLDYYPADPPQEDVEKLQKELVDVANFCMMIYSKLDLVADDDEP